MSNTSSGWWNFAVVVGNEVTSILVVSVPVIIAAYSSNPRIVPVQELLKLPNGAIHQSFQVFVGEELAITVGYELNEAALIAGLCSDPTIIPVDPNHGISAGWTWDGTNFTETFE